MRHQTYIEVMRHQTCRDNETSDIYQDNSPAVSREDKQISHHETNNSILRQFIVGRQIHHEKTDKTRRKLTFRRPISYSDNSSYTAPKNAGFIH